MQKILGYKLWDKTTTPYDVECKPSKNGMWSCRIRNDYNKIEDKVRVVRMYSTYPLNVTLLSKHKVSIIAHRVNLIEDSFTGEKELHIQ
jgi:hypothetical protein